MQIFEKIRNSQPAFKFTGSYKEGCIANKLAIRSKLTAISCRQSMEISKMRATEHLKLIIAFL